MESKERRMRPGGEVTPKRTGLGGRVSIPEKRLRGSLAKSGSQCLPWDEGREQCVCSRTQCFEQWASCSSWCSYLWPRSHVAALEDSKYSHLVAQTLTLPGATAPATGKREADLPLLEPFTSPQLAVEGSRRDCPSWKGSHCFFQ